MVIDGHSDALYKMWTHKAAFYDDSRLDVNYKKWMNSPVKVQCFAIYVPESVPMEAKFVTALEMVDLFYEKVIKAFPSIRMIRNKSDIAGLQYNEKGAILTLEGLDCIGNNLSKLRILLRLGVLMVGMSWNTTNYAVDGIGVDRGGGLTAFGREVIRLANNEKKWIDLAHISCQGFEQAIQLAEYPVVSHANSSAICPHPRNLTDQQIRKIIAKNGLIGITFVREFISPKIHVNIKDLMPHIDHMLKLGAGHTLMFGSDFDGTDSFPDDLSSIDHYQHLLNILQTRYAPSIVKQISSKNFLDRFPV